MSQHRFVSRILETGFERMLWLFGRLNSFIAQNALGLGIPTYYKIIRSLQLELSKTRHKPNSCNNKTYHDSYHGICNIPYIFHFICEFNFVACFLVLHARRRSCGVMSLIPYKFIPNISSLWLVETLVMSYSCVHLFHVILLN